MREIKIISLKELIEKTKGYLLHGSRIKFEQVSPRDNARVDTIPEDEVAIARKTHKYLEIEEIDLGDEKLFLGVKWQRKGERAAAFFTDNPLVALSYTSDHNSNSKAQMGIDMYQEPRDDAQVTVQFFSTDTEDTSIEKSIDHVFGDPHQPANIAYMYLAECEKAHPFWEPGLGKMECISTDCEQEQATVTRLEFNPSQLMHEAIKTKRILSV